MKFLRLLLFVLAIGFSAKSNAVLVREATACEEWTKPTSALMHYQDKWWLLGYLSAMAVLMDKDFLREAEEKYIFLWMDNYCKINPKNNTIDGGTKLADELIMKMKKK